MVDIVYGTPAGFRAYHAARDRTLPADADDDNTVNAWLLVASEWIDGQFRAMFPGTKVGMRAQVREWPRDSAFDIYGYLIASTSVPDEMINATYEAALIEGNSPGAFAINYTPSKYKRASVDGAVSVEYATFSSAADAQTQYPIIGQILAPLLSGSSYGFSVGSLSGAVQRV